MALTKKPVTGMKDITPAEMQIREYVMNQIRDILDVDAEHGALAGVLQQ